MGCAVFRAGHGLPYAAPTRTPPDPDLFPSYIQNKQGLWLRFAEWWPRKAPGEVKSVVFIVSGLSEHANRYDSVAVRLNREGAVCFSVDNAGAGGSEGQRLYIERFDYFVDDIWQFISFILDKYPELRELPRVLIGHSMGGLISFLTAVRAPAGFFSSVVLSGPAFKVVGAPAQNGFLYKILNFISRMTPKMEITRLDLNLISYNKPVVELEKQDPYVSNVKLRARFLSEFMAAQERAVVEMKNMKTSFPLLILFGEKDALCCLSRAREIFDLFPSESKEMKTYPNAGHEVLTEVDRKTVLNDMVEFIKKHYAQESSA